MFSASGRVGEIPFSYWTKVSHCTIVVFSEGVPDLRGRIPLKPYTFQIGGQGKLDDENEMMRSLLPPLPVLPRPTHKISPVLQWIRLPRWDSPPYYGKKKTWETIIVTSRNYLCGKCDKYWHPTTVGRGVATRYGMEWRSACTSGMARVGSISDSDFPLVGAEDGAHHAGDLAERGVDDRGGPGTIALKRVSAAFCRSTLTRTRPVLGYPRYIGDTPGSPDGP